MSTRPEEKEAERIKELDRLSHSASEKDAEYILIHHRPIIWELIAEAKKAEGLRERLKAAEEVLQHYADHANEYVWVARKAKEYFARFPKRGGSDAR